MKNRERWICMLLGLYILICLMMLTKLKPPLGKLGFSSTSPVDGLEFIRKVSPIVIREMRDSNVSFPKLEEPLRKIAENIIKTTPATSKKTTKKPTTKVIAPTGKDFDIFSYPKYEMCSGSVTSYKDIFFSFRNVFIDRSKATAKMAGGEDPLKFLGKSTDDDEFYVLKKGFFVQPCFPDGKLNRTFSFTKNAAHTKTWMPNVEFTANSNLIDDLNRRAASNDYTGKTKQRITLAMMRYEFANVYWVLMDIYAAFITAKYFNSSLAECDILLIDAHPATQLDPLYYKTSHHTRLLSGTSQLTQYSHLVWPYTRVYSPLLNQQEKSHPILLSEFRSFILERFEIKDNHTSPCGSDRKFNVLFPWRHDYIAHPRNPSGVVTRKISNEKEIIEAVEKNLSSSVSAQGIQLDSLSLPEQLRLISHTDIMIGMHGAAFAFVTFLPQNSSVIEIYPKGSSLNWHMGNLAKWNGHHYKSSISKVSQDKNKSTKISPSVIISLLTEAMQKLCPTKKT